MKYILTILMAAAGIHAAEIVLPSPALERDAPVTILYRTNALATGKGQLDIEWTDSHGRLVDSRKIPVELADENEFRFPIDLRRARAMKNELRARFTFDGVNKKGQPDHRDERAQVSFIASPPERAWRDYHIIMWQPHSADKVPLLKSLGINAGQFVGRNRPAPEFLFHNDLRWYAENVATDFYAQYHRWFPDRPVNWAFTEAKELYKKDRTSKEAFKRRPSLSDPAWLQKIRDRLVDVTRMHAPYRPLFYDLGDESGIADLAAYWDFDFSDHSLVEMRVWLRERYGSLPALNAQWGTSFAYWDAVMPETANETMKRTDGNHSAWSDHKEWMDVSFARALKMGVDAVRSVDPAAYVGIAGAQMPGWGGYDYARLSQVLTMAEPYNIGNNIEILRSLNPDLPVVTTSFQGGSWEKHRVWYELLHGGRGLIIWDDQNGFIAKDGAVGKRGEEARPYYTELRSGLGALLIDSRRQADPIAIHYSQPSLRAEWLRAQKGPEAWLTTGARAERSDNEFLRLRESFCRLIEDLGLQYNFVSYLQLEQGELMKRGYRVLILPRSSALSEAEAAAIRDFAAQGGTVIASGEPGVYDEHCRRLSASRLADLFTAAGGRGKVVMLDDGVLNYHRQRLQGQEGPMRERMRGLLQSGGVEPEFAVVDSDGVETHTFRNGGVTLIGLLSNPQLRVDELGPPEFKSNERFEKSRTVRLKLPREMQAYDVRASKTLGALKEISVTLDPYEPAIFALSPEPLPALRLAAPERIARGSTTEIGVSFASSTAASIHVLHVEVSDPAGKVVPHYSGNLLAPNGRAAHRLPVAHNDPAGRWRIVVHDLLSGQSQTATVEVI